MDDTLASQCYDFYHWMFSHRSKRLGMKCMWFLGCIFLLVAGCALWFFHYELPRIDGMVDSAATGYHGRWKLEQAEESDEALSNLRLHIEDLKRIKISVRNELRDLEEKQHKLREEIANYSVRLDTLKVEFEKDNKQLIGLKLSIDSAQQLRQELNAVHVPLLQAPVYVASSTIDDTLQSATPTSCHSSSCFDYSRCRLASKFYAYLYSKEELWLANVTVDSASYDSLRVASQQSTYITTNPEVACVFIVFVSSISSAPKSVSYDSYISSFQKLKFWGSHGINHVVLSTVTTPKSFGGFIRSSSSQLSRALLAQTDFSYSSFRQGFDIVLCPTLESKPANVWSQLPPMVPAFRKFLLTFVGGRPAILSSSPSQIQLNMNEQSYHNKLKPLLQLEQFIIKTLKDMQTNYADDGFIFEYSCAKEEIAGSSNEWTLCEQANDRQNVLVQSTFSLILAPIVDSHISSVLTQIRIYEALKYGSIPVILGDHVVLPFADLLAWKQAVIILPKARITELHYYLRSIGQADVLNMRRNGRVLWTTHCSSAAGMLETTLATIRHRLGIPASPMPDFHADMWFVGNFSLLTRQYAAPPAADADEFLGPLEFPYFSPNFLRNHTQQLDAFRSDADPFHLFPHTPFDPVMIPDAHFIGPTSGFRPIGGGMGGAGKEFSEALGGNHPHEQFTIVLLTYEREAVMLDALLRLRGLPYLNKVIVVWNSPRPPSPDLLWPDIGVPVNVAKMTKNSLNNRFLPFEAIQTEAILSLDDDVHLRRDEIIFGFRVWRQARDQIVGFPGRFHSWDAIHQTWRYNSNFSCELSMVLTGAAFFHKYYTYLYSHVMPPAIRDKVDEYLNCEDIAMNFLVAHVTRKPPIKVTSRWTFLCPECPSALSIEEEHFHERHKCFDFFVKVYGYMPLLYTQLRADSVLFKTKIPHDKQKCFRYV